MPRYRNDGSMPLNYGDQGPCVNPGETFDTADYPAIPQAQVESHLQSRFISEVTASPLVIVDELHEHVDRALIDALTTTAKKTK
jgi:hypothetical protein